MLTPADPGGEAATMAPRRVVLPVAPRTGEESNTIRAGLRPIGALRIDDLRFSFGGSFLVADAATELAMLRGLLEDLPGARIAVFGHDDRSLGDEGAWQLAGRRALSVVCAIPGRIVAKPGAGAGHRFEPSPSYRWPTVAAGPGTFRLQLDGETAVHRLAIPQDPLEDDSDLYGVAWKLMVRFVHSHDKDGRLLFESQGWVLLRDFRNFSGVEAGRPVVAFHATGTGGPHRPDGYADAAAAYWELHADINAKIDSLEKILQFLRGEELWGESTLIKRDWVLGPWGQVNIIAHGWFHAWGIAVLAGTPRLDNQYIPEQEWISRFELEDKRKAYAAGRMLPPGPHLLDERSKIAIRGCVIGRDEAFAREIFETFGGRAPTYVSKLLSVYDHDERGRPRASARECWVHVRRTPAQNDPGAQDGENPPAPHARAAFLARKYDRSEIDRRAPGYDHAAERVWMGRVTEPLEGPPPIPLDQPRVVSFEIDFARDHPDAHRKIELAKRHPTHTWQGECRIQWFTSVFQRELASGRQEDLIGTSMVPDEAPTAAAPGTGTWRWRPPAEIAPGKIMVRLAAQASLTMPRYRVDHANRASARRQVDIEDTEQYLRVAAVPRRP